MNLIYWVSVAIGISVFLWPTIYTLKLKRYTQDELAAIDPKFQKINQSYLRYGIWGAIGFIPILAGLVRPLSLENTNQRTYLLSAFMILAFSFAAFFHASFAVRYNLYPASKYFGPNTRYIYEPHSQNKWGSINKISRIQMAISGWVWVGALIMILFLWASL